MLSNFIDPAIHNGILFPQKISIFSAASIDTLGPIQIPHVLPGTLLAAHFPPFALQEEWLGQPAPSDAIDHF